MDFSKLSDSDLQQIAKGDMRMVSVKGLQMLAGDEPQANKLETSKTDRFIQGIKDPIDAGAQLLTHILPKGLVDAGNNLNNYLADKTGLLSHIPSGGIDQMLNEQAANYQKPEGIDWARLGGNVLSPANLAVASKFPVAASLGGRVLSGVGAGASLGALSPVINSDNYAQDKAKQIGISAAVGGAFPVLTSGVSRLVSPKASLNPNISLLKSEGVNPTIGQTLGGRSNTFEEKLQSVPIMGDMISNARQKANLQFENAAYNRALNPIGQELPKGISGREALSYTESTLKNTYDDVLNKIGAIKPDSQFNSNVSNLESMVNKLLMPKAEKAKFASALNDVKSSIDNNGVITSDAFKTLESSLGSDASKLGASTNIYEGKLSPAVKQLQAELRDMLKRQAGSSADDLKATNTAWANFKRVQNAGSKLGADSGNFSPSQLQNAVRALDKSKDKAAFARGNALMQDLGDAGKSVLGNKVPDSGTAGRLIMGGGALGSYLINPAIPASLLGGAGLYTQPAQSFLNALITKRPELAQSIASSVKQSSPYLTPAALGLLNYK